MKRRLRCIIFEAPDNCGKDTQIRLMLAHFARKRMPFHVLHYSAPRVEPEVSRDYFENHLYESMFRFVLKSREDCVFALNRAHISETVYAPMYRQTSGDFVFDMEVFWKTCKPKAWDEMCLVTFVDKPANLISREDGLSFSTDLDKKMEEVYKFVEGTNASAINHKIVISIDGKGPEAVHSEVMDFLLERFDV